MERFATQDLKKWLQSTRRKPLVIRGARQVGKSTLVRNFCRDESLELIEINLEKKKLKSLRDDEILISEIISEIEFEWNVDLSSNKALVFFDEIQEQPRLFTALRYFYEERPNLPIIAAGSLLELMLSEQRVSVPVGRIEYLYLGPMSFGEFLKAQGGTKLYQVWEQGPSSIPPAAHQALLKLLQQYFFVGGMPEAVSHFIETKSHREVRRVQENILQTYQDDFSKYASRTQTEKLRKVLHYIPHHLGEKARFVAIDSESKSRDLRTAIELLRLARVIILTRHSQASGLPLSAQADENVFKLFFMDVGLAGAILGIRFADMIHENLLTMVRGHLAEQFVAQHLFLRKDMSMDRSLYYWLRDKSSQKAEIDFLISSQQKIIPIEVKAEKSGKLKSLISYCGHRKSDIALQIDQSEYSIEKARYKSTDPEKPTAVSFDLVHLPLYWVEKLDQLF